MKWLLGKYHPIFLLWFIHPVLTVYVMYMSIVRSPYSDDGMTIPHIYNYIYISCFDHGTWVILRIEVGVGKMMTWQYVIPPPNNKYLSRPLGLVLEYWIYLFWVPMWEVFLFHILLVQSRLIYRYPNDGTSIPILQLLYYSQKKPQKYGKSVGMGGSILGSLCCKFYGY